MRYDAKKKKEEFRIPEKPIFLSFSAFGKVKEEECCILNQSKMLFDSYQRIAKLNYKVFY